MSNSDLPRVGSVEEFRAEQQSAVPISNVPVTLAGYDKTLRSAFVAEVKAQEETRSILFKISTASVDRMGDTISVDGWKLEAYRKNPVVLWAHDSRMLPVAKAPKVWIEDGALKAEAEFTPLGMAKFNDTVFEMYKQGFLSATSVGFLPRKYAFSDAPERRNGIDFLEQELLEFSAVPVPANADALIEGKAAGIPVGPLLDWATDQVLRSGDIARILKLAEDIVGGVGDDARLLRWASDILAKQGLVPASIERIERIERAARQQRLKEKRARDQDVIRARAR